ncbi:MAG: two-component regulator propeller domain-containing protein [Bacteroidales bacterium]|nr:two-component regulator propeller domain-containing protein [Bacteroidales bacterium]
MRLFRIKATNTRHAAILSLLALCCLTGVRAQIRVEAWRSHLSYNHIYSVQAAGKYAYAAAAQGMMRVDRTTGKRELLDKTTGLTDVGVSAFAYDSATKSLVIAYVNSNIDILQDGETFNVGDIRRSSISGDKSIRNIRFHGGNAYLACAFGVVALDLHRMEIKETYYLPITPVLDLAFFGDTLYAATEKGVLCAPLASNLSIAANWMPADAPLLAAQSVRHLAVTSAGWLLATVYDSSSAQSTLYARTSATGFVPILYDKIENVRVGKRHVLVCAGDSLLVFTPQMERYRSLGGIDWMSMEIEDADMDDDQHLWLAHKWAGLMEYDFEGGRLQNYSPQSPWTDNVYRLVPDKGRILLCHGGKSKTGVNANLKAALGFFDNEAWHSMHPGDADTLRDIVSAAVNPNNAGEVLAAAWGYGIIRIVDGKLVDVFNEGNTSGALKPYSEGGFRSLRTGDVCFDRGGNAWMTNSLVQNGIVERRKDGTWHSYSIGSLYNATDIDHILFDTANGVLWFYGRVNRLCAIRVASDGSTQLAYVNPNNGSKVSTTAVNCLVQDYNGELWMGTDKGIKKIFDGYKIFQNGGKGELSPVSCSNILISEGDMVEYLMAYESVTAIVVDGANRKWVGTANGGLYLLSANGLTQLEHYTVVNSPLFSNKIVALAFNPQNGELFIGTDKGLLSFRTTATYAGSDNSEHIHVFPNPVQPGYDGLIAINGFSRNAIVHITDAAGHTVFTTTAHGGQAVWNKRTNSGEEVATGVYFVFASNEEGKMRAVTKILVIK